jgi:hypothetical protein
VEETNQILAKTETNKPNDSLVLSETSEFVRNLPTNSIAEPIEVLRPSEPVEKETSPKEDEDAMMDESAIQNEEEEEMEEKLESVVRHSQTCVFIAIM